MLLISKLDTLLTDIIDIAEANQVSSDLSLWVEALVFVFESYMWNPHRGDWRCLSWRKPSLNKVERLVAFTLDGCDKRIGIHVERVCEAANIIGVIDNFRGINANGYNRGAHRQRFAIAVENDAAIGRDRNGSNGSIVALAL